LIARLKDKLDPAEFEFLSPDAKSDHASFLTFRSRRIASEKLFDALEKNDIVISLRIDRANRAWLRVSPHFYNTLAEMDRIAEMLSSVVGPP
jgi:selenocysteine lyase/cysteine desulfurase